MAQLYALQETPTATHLVNHGKSLINENGMIYRGPRDFVNTEELVIASNDNPVLLLFTRGFPTLVRLSCEQATGESRERGWDVVVLELVHPPAPDGHLWSLGDDIVRTLNQLGVLLRGPYQLMDEFVVFNGVDRAHRG